MWAHRDPMYVTMRMKFKNSDEVLARLAWWFQSPRPTCTLSLRVVILDDQSGGRIMHRLAVLMKKVTNIVRDALSCFGCVGFNYRVGIQHRLVLLFENDVVNKMNNRRTQAGV